MKQRLLITFRQIPFTCQRYFCSDTKNTTLPPTFKSSKELLENAVNKDDRFTNDKQDPWTTPTYHEIDEAKKLLKPKKVNFKKYKPPIDIVDEDHSENSILLFPGQGCQFVGMGKNAIEKAPATKDLFQRASTILGYNLLDICLKVRVTLKLYRINSLLWLLSPFFL